mmetsp:Transcript_29191/g.63351  ORF Transcript_29191/g.63351 Transcript_29191/m.63351 type:complete len:855 (-) Transcript_29191:221-2785(-)
MSSTAIRQALFMGFVGWSAYNIRLHAVETYGMVIHEFDPWFNYRAAEYLATNGPQAFFKWFDYTVWYPLGRPVGTTIYPGMQFVAVWIWKLLPFLGVEMSLHDVCVMIPAWFGVVASLAVSWLSYEASGSVNAALFGGMIMAIIPAHLMRSVAGGFDNEAVAMAFIVATFALWCRSLQSNNSWPIGALAGLTYFSLVATWGGYVYAVNMIALHCLVLFLLGQDAKKLHHAYSLFFLVGTAPSLLIPVVNYAPLRSLEQIAPLGLFIFLQLLEVCRLVGKWRNMDDKQFVSFRWTVFLSTGALLSAVAALLFQMGYFAPLSARVRGLFIAHTRTGNPLVDSVAEHQATHRRSYWRFLHNACFMGPLGGCFLLMRRPIEPAKSFLLLCGVVTYHFSFKMNRLLLLLAPPASALGGIAYDALVDILFTHLIGGKRGQARERKTRIPAETPVAADTATNPTVNRSAAAAAAADGRSESKGSTLSDSKSKSKGKTKNGSDAGSQEKPQDEIQKESQKSKDRKSPPTSGAKTDQAKEASQPVQEPQPGNSTSSKTYQGPLGGLPEEFSESLAEAGKDLAETAKAFLRETPNVRVAATTLLGMVLYYMASEFWFYSHRIAVPMSSPVIVYADKHGEIVDDYRETYGWIRNNTPEDARIMAWWDYGYQINGLANRTTIADGNTWNHEHIATLGRCLVSPEEEAHGLLRHLADYVLVWAGGGGDDIAKSPHMARIASSVYRQVCPDDPKCTTFKFNEDGEPSEAMSASLLWKLSQHKLQPLEEGGVVANPSLFSEVYTSKRGLVRVFRVENLSVESKEWVADPANRKCDAPGSWYCQGQYPPAFAEIIRDRQAFKQLEDFNSK